MSAITQLSCLNNILAKYNIHPKFHAEFRELIECGVRPSKELRIRLDNVTNYKAALNEAMVALCKPHRHQFPPVIFQSLSIEERI